MTTDEDWVSNIVACRRIETAASLIMRLDGYGRELIVKTLAQTQGNRAAVAKILGLQRTYLSRLIKSLGVR
jgi:DNA-binding NtrC family response regulator